MKRVVITGTGALTPIGNSVSEYWNALVAGKSGAGPITRFDAEHYKTKFACELKDFDPRDYMDRNDVRKNDPYVIYALAATQQAIDNAELDFEKTDRTRVGVIWGTGVGGFDSFEKEVMNYARGSGVPRFNPYFIVKTIPNMASGIISIKHGLMGINHTVISACATSNSAIMDAFNYIRLGKADIIISGGSEASITHAAMGGFSSMKALSTRNEDPESASRPFDKERDGFVMGEGSGALILEDYDHAVKRGANILAEVKGASSTADAYHLSATHPEGLGARNAMRAALEEAELSISDIGYINAHATSTPVGDVSELKAIKTVIGDADSDIKISSTKSMTGHLLGAAGAVEAIASIEAIRHNMIPPTINVNDMAEEADGLDIVANKAVEKEVNYAMSNTFGFGGHNAICIFGKV